MLARMVLSFTIVLVVLLFALSSILYVSFENIQTKTVTENNAKILSQISYSANYLNDNARNFTFSVFGDAVTTQLMYQNRIDYMDLIAQAGRLRDLAQKNASVHTLYVYNKRLGQYFSTTDAPLNDESSFFDQEMNAIIVQASGEPRSFSPIPRLIKLNPNDPNSASTKVYTYSLYDFSSEKGGVEGAVIVNMKIEYLQNIINSLKLKNNMFEGEIVIIDRDGKVMNDSESHPFLSNLSDQPFVNRVLRAQGDSGYFLDTDTGRDMLVSYVYSDILGWKFIQVLPYELITNQFQQMKQITIGVCTAVLLLGLLISLLVSRRLYSPIRSLVRRVAIMTDAPASRERRIDEVRLLTQAFDETFDKAKLLDQTKRDMLRIRKNDALAGLLSSEFNGFEPLCALFGKYDIPLNPRRSVVLITLLIDRRARFAAAYSVQDQALFTYAVINAARELFAEIGDSDAVELENNRIVFLVQLKDQALDEFKHNIVSVIEHIQMWSQMHLSLSLSASFGYIAQDFSELKQLYRESVNLSKYRLIYGHNSVVTPDMLKDQSTDPFKLSKQFEKNLHDALFNGKLEDARTVYEETLSGIAGYSYDSVMSAMLYVTSSMYNMLNIVEGNSLNKFNVDFNSFMQHVTNAETIDEINELFYDLFTRIAGVVHDRKHKRTNVVTGTIVKLIEANYRDSSLCLESIASTINMSKVYAGKLFREEFGKSVADYITELRIAKAIELLDEGSKHFSDIVDEIGIENKNYFYKQFKAKVGVSLSEYKLKYVNDSAEPQSK
ncbi:AraC family transcriptional regulator [Paenibacillus thalictri]|nr:cache domain-containing protein [Paenibacillus thalictri]